MNKKQYKYFLIVCIALVLILPGIQMLTGIFKLSPLLGVDETKDWPGVNSRDWFSGDFQASFDASFEENLGFRPPLVRMKNQLDYHLFKKANASGVIVGKDHYLYEWDYIRARMGMDFIGEKAIEEKVRRTKFVQDTLLKLGKFFFVVMEPGKANYLPEFLPDKYQSKSPDTTNYKYFCKHFEKHQINHLDLNAYFISLKDKTQYPLFPKGGIHWSQYGSVLAYDTIISYIEGNYKIDLPELQIKDIETPNDLRNSDDDLLRIMNLAVSPKHLQMAYPKLEIEMDSTKDRPAILSIADSFYWNFRSNNTLDEVFNPAHFWYYFAGFYSEDSGNDTIPDALPLQKQIDKHDIISVMITQRFMMRYAWDFIDSLYYMFKPNSFENPVWTYENAIRKDYNRFDKVLEEAKLKGISLEESIRGHANYLVWQDRLKMEKAGNTHSMEYYIRKVFSDRNIMKSVREKCKTNGNSEFDQVLLEAKALFTSKESNSS